MKPYLRMKSKNEMVAIEAARVICELHWLYEKDLVFAVTGNNSNNLNIFINESIFSLAKFPFFK